MATAYYKRYRMMVDLPSRRPGESSGSCPEPVLPPGYSWAAWPQPFNPTDDETFLERHARTKVRCFAEELDAGVFACLGDLIGCRRLMREIRRKRGFLFDATWLIVAPDGEDCATIQGVLESGWLGSIQNVGVVPDHRGLGLGKALVIRALQGFTRAGATKATLEVTAANQPAIALYQRLGFRRTRTSYKAVERAVPTPTHPEAETATTGSSEGTPRQFNPSAGAISQPVPLHGVVVVPTIPARSAPVPPSSPIPSGGAIEVFSPETTARPAPPSSSTQGFGL